MPGSPRFTILEATESWAGPRYEVRWYMYVDMFGFTFFTEPRLARAH